MTEISPYAFYLLAALVLFPALAVVSEKNLFHAGISLIVCFLGVAGIYVTLTAPFIAGMQVLIYAGAIAVILLFAFMLTHDIMHVAQERFQPVAGILTCAVLAFMLTVTVLRSQWAAPVAASVDLGVKSLALHYMTVYFVPFQAIALLLLITLVGAVVIARKEEEPRG